MTEFSIREASQKDIQAIFEVLSEADQLHSDAHPEIFRADGFEHSAKNYYRACIVGPEVNIFIAEVQKKIIGAVICSINHSQKNPALVPRKFGLIENIAIYKEYRKTGVGKALMQRAQQWVAAMGASSIELTVWEFNQNAIKFYQSLGFETVHHKMRKELK